MRTCPQSTPMSSSAWIEKRDRSSSPRTAANAAVAPRRAVATRAVAVGPPPLRVLSLTAILVLGGGCCSTKKRSSTVTAPRPRTSQRLDIGERFIIVGHQFLYRAENAFPTALS